MLEGESSSKINRAQMIKFTRVDQFVTNIILSIILWPFIELTDEAEYCVELSSVANFATWYTNELYSGEMGTRTETTINDSHMYFASLFRRDPSLYHPMLPDWYKRYNDTIAS